VWVRYLTPLEQSCQSSSHPTVRSGTFRCVRDRERTFFSSPAHRPVPPTACRLHLPQPFSDRTQRSHRAPRGRRTFHARSATARTRRRRKPIGARDRRSPRMAVSSADASHDGLGARRPRRHAPSLRFSRHVRDGSPRRQPNPCPHPRSIHGPQRPCRPNDAVPDRTTVDSVRLTEHSPSGRVHHRRRRCASSRYRPCPRSPHPLGHPR
jgi:hypothetical protein